jgi:hypothetical protein
MIMLEVSNADPAAVSKTLEILVGQTEVTLRNLQQQAQVPDAQMVTSIVVSAPSAPVGAMPSRTRSTVAVFLAGAGLAVLMTVLLDALLTRHKAKRRQGRELAEVGVEQIPVEAPTDIYQPTPAATAGKGAPEAR